MFVGDTIDDVDWVFALVMVLLRFIMSLQFPRSNGYSVCTKLGDPRAWIADTAGPAQCGGGGWLAVAAVGKQF